MDDKTLLLISSQSHNTDVSQYQIVTGCRITSHEVRQISKLVTWKNT
jgi:hypothetical protein